MRPVKRVPTTTPITPVSNTTVFCLKPHGFLEAPTELDRSADLGGSFVSLAAVRGLQNQNRNHRLSTAVLETKQLQVHL